MTTLRHLWKLDAYKLASYKYLLLILLVLSIGSFFIQPLAVLYFLVVLMYFVGVTLIAFDEQYHSNYLYGTLPVSRRQIVAARFLLYFLIMTALLLLCLLLASLSPKTTVTAMMPLLVGGYSFSLIFCGLLQALCFRFRYSIVRFASLGIYIAAFVLIGVVIQIFPQLITLGTASILLTFIGGLVFFAGLFALGLKLYLRKDFTD